MDKDEYEVEPTSTLSTILVFVFLVLPWLIGLGAVFNWLFDGWLW